MPSALNEYINIIDLGSNFLVIFLINPTSLDPRSGAEIRLVICRNPMAISHTLAGEIKRKILWLYYIPLPRILPFVVRSSAPNPNGTRVSKLGAFAFVIIIFIQWSSLVRTTDKSSFWL